MPVMLIGILSFGILVFAISYVIARRYKAIEASLFLPELNRCRISHSPSYRGTTPDLALA